MEKSSGTLRERRKTVERIVRNMLIQNLVKNFCKNKIFKPEAPKVEAPAPLDR